ncbi:MAG TPA: FAD-dependent oxidoreductase, partial [Candidatus Lokiarchaeia archaeon]|nr:FAD-dependent oxidoreductase [Candidatus Lokiarchaeia archaeon]
METEFDVLIVGAGTAGTYLAWLLAKQGAQVAVLEREAREHVGSRLEVFHVVSVAFEKFGIPPSLAGTPELIAVWDEGTTYSADGTIAIMVRYGFHVMRLS